MFQVDGRNASHTGQILDRRARYAIVISTGERLAICLFYHYYHKKLFTDTEFIDNKEAWFLRCVCLALVWAMNSYKMLQR